MDALIVLGEKLQQLSLAPGATLSFIGADGRPATVNNGPLTLVVDGVATDQITFHSFDSSLNPDDLEHTISSVDANTGLVCLNKSGPCFELGSASNMELIYGQESKTRRDYSEVTSG